MTVQINDAVAAINQVQSCRSEDQADDIVRTFLNALAIPSHQYIFSSVTLASCEPGMAPAPADYRYLVGCNPAFMQFYIHRKWYMNDPFIAYAINHTVPASSSTFGDVSHGQRDFLASLHQHGFLDYLVAPARLAGSTRVGTFLVGSAEEPKGAAGCSLQEHRALFRTMSAELLELMTRLHGAVEAMRLGLSSQEVAVLKILADGGNAMEVAVQLGTTTNRVHRKIYPDIIAKMGMRNISESLRRAAREGLLAV
jgi:DNA-binding CsgD family transcriptional regulator